MPKNTEHMLRIVVDEGGHKQATKLYDTYIRRDDGDFKRFPEFLLALDRLISEFGGVPIPDEEIEEKRREKEAKENDDRDNKRPLGTKNDRRDDDDEDYPDDYDIHEEETSSEVDVIKDAIITALRN